MAGVFRECNWLWISLFIDLCLFISNAFPLCLWIGRKKRERKKKLVVPLLLSKFYFLKRILVFFFFTSDLASSTLLLDQRSYFIIVIITSAFFVPFSLLGVLCLLRSWNRCKGMRCLTCQRVFSWLIMIWLSLFSSLQIVVAVLSFWLWSSF